MLTYELPRPQRDGVSPSGQALSADRRRKKKWFLEEGIPGKRSGKVKHSFLIDKVIFNGKTPLQKVLIFDNPVYGRIFCLDDIVQFSESDEFIYHEMISHPVLFSHPGPKNILIIGGGDGGALREVLKHKVQRIDLVEIDKKIIEISKKYLKFVCQNFFSDKRVKIYNLPGEEFITSRMLDIPISSRILDGFAIGISGVPPAIKKHKDAYDIVIIDCTNQKPGGISDFLYSEKFYKELLSALKRDGIIITLGASFLDFDFIKIIYGKLKKLFPSAAIYRFCMPSYHCGEYCFVAASKKIDLEKVNLKELEKKYNKLTKKYNFRYYSPKIHQASLVLPKIWQIKKWTPLEIR